MGVGAAYDRHVQHSRQLDVVDVAALAGQELSVLLAQRRDADALACVGRDAHAGTPCDADRTAATMLWYPVQRQRLPSRPWRISSSLGFGLASSSLIAAITMPGVQ